MGFGAKEVKIEYSLDGSAWTELKGVPEFAQATGLPTYTHSTTVSFGGAMAKYVKLTIAKSWGAMMTQTSLSEVRFFSVPVLAREPQPADGATDVGVATDLLWRPGREAQSHKVYFGTDAGAVAAGTVPAATQTEHSFTPPSLAFGTTYYWKVDEVGDGGTYAGNLWSFTIQEFAVPRGFRELQRQRRRRHDHLPDLDRRRDHRRQRLDRGICRSRPGDLRREDDRVQRQSVDAAAVRQHGDAVLLRSRARVCRRAELDGQGGRRPAVVRPRQGGQLPGDDQGRDDHERHRDRHLGHRRPVPLRLQEPQRRRLDGGPRRQPDSQRRLGQGGRDDPREPPSRLEARVRLPDAGLRGFVPAASGDRQRDEPGVDKHRWSPRPG